ncbi:TnpV protein [Coprococcus comes]|uniref:TnpV protein n=1 Tax=Coprococcus comes TaxID=410072 RepID=UPI0034A1EC6D
MTFSEKLKQAMQELHLNQRQVCGMTGKSKGSVSQYLSGKQIPSEDVQSAIAVALGLESDYFSKSDEQVVVLPTAELKNGVIPRLDVEKAAKLLQMNHNTVRKRVTYLNLLTSGKLNEHLYQTEQTALQRLELLTKQLSEEQGVTEELKEKAPMVCLLRIVVCRPVWLYRKRDYPEIRRLRGRLKLV